MAKDTNTRLRELTLLQLEIVFEVEDIANEFFATEAYPPIVGDAARKVTEAFDALRFFREQAGPGGFLTEQEV